MIDNDKAKFILSADDFEEAEFEEYHTFQVYEENIIQNLILHGPILLKGSRGSGKTALLKEAYFRTRKSPYSENIVGIFVNLRHMPLLQKSGSEYENYFCTLVSSTILNSIAEPFLCTNSVTELQSELIQLAKKIKKRIILFFDDAAHLGRESSLQTFFDIFRTLSCSYISCKATIYPGVTEFGTRFDMLNDATVIDVARNDEFPQFDTFFLHLLQKRFNKSLGHAKLPDRINLEQMSRLLAICVNGNPRAFIKACGKLVDNASSSEKIELLNIENTIKSLATDYFWPLLQEIEPKLGPYEKVVPVADAIANILLEVIDKNYKLDDYGNSCLISKIYTEKLKKAFEILEYVGFIVKKEASRKLKSGGRGPRYVFNLSLILENQGRLTYSLVEKAILIGKEYSEIYKNEQLDVLNMPIPDQNKELSILDKSIDVLKKSNAYPYGLTPIKIDSLREKGYLFVKDLIDADEELLQVNGIAYTWRDRIKSVVGQAVWM